MENVGAQEAPSPFLEKKILLVDLDTPIVRAAAVCQNNYMAVRRDTGERIPTSSMKKFKENYPCEDLDNIDFVEEASLIELSDGTPIEARGKKTIKDFCESLFRIPWVDKVYFVFGGEGNFRHQVAVTWPYKGARGEKPILTNALKDYVTDRYPNNIIIANGIEADDILGIEGWRSYLRAENAKDPQEANVVLAHIDKDIDMVPGWHWHYDKKELRWVTRFEGGKFFFKQLLYGDKATDNIPGLNAGPVEMFKAFGARKTASVGEKTADKILEGAETLQECFRRVQWCYEMSYPDTWMEYMQEQADLLWMQHEKDGRFLVEEAYKVYGKGNYGEEASGEVEG